MPYRQEWFEAPKDMSLKVLAELPEGVTEQKWSFAIREARGRFDHDYKTFHFCKRCGGWIEGFANEFSVNTLNPSQLSGRSGKEYYCRRCGEHIGFMGMMS